MPYGFPSGSHLLNVVCERLWRDDCDEHKSVRSLGFSTTDIVDFVEALRETGYWSVDSFLASETDWMELGKGAIAATLLTFENSDPLFPPRAPQSSWYQWLANEILDSHYTKKHLSVITFNYDRSLEYYLHRVVARRNRLTLSEALDWLSDHLEIVHVHGSLGSLNLSDNLYVPFGTNDLIPIIRNSVESIIVLPEAKAGSREFQRARSLLSRSKDIDILGFGFGDDNLRRLGLHPDSRLRFVGEGPTFMRATTMGLSARRWDELHPQLTCSEALMSSRRYNWDVGKFFRELG